MNHIQKRFLRLKYISGGDRFALKLGVLKDFLWKNLNTNHISTLPAVIKGQINFHAISDNRRRVGQLIYQNTRIIHRWFNRQGVRHGMSWEKLDRILRAVSYPETWKTTSISRTR